MYSSIPREPTYPLVIVTRQGGEPASRRRLDSALIQFDVYGTNQSAARELAAEVRQAIFATEGTEHPSDGGAVSAHGRLWRRSTRSEKG